jgi:hypothetical protein
MIWTLDMDDFNGEFCRKNKKQSIHKFPLVNAIKKEFQIDEITTPISIETTTTILSNETILLNDEFQNLLDEMFFNASSSSSSEISQTYLFLFNLLTISYLIRSTINIIS